MSEAPRHENQISQWLFLRLLALIYLIAFASLAVQIKGLIGQHGILPAHTFLELVKQNTGSNRYTLLPTLFWMNSSDAFLLIVCIGGAILSACLFFGICTTPILVILWISYLSFMTVGQDFLAFQWDVLLLEAGFLAIFLAPPLLMKRHAIDTPPTNAVVWLLRWLLFRLMFSSGMTKLLSGDTSWRNFTAMNYHYETQPLPTWIGWFAHQLPSSFQKFSTFVVLIVEAAVPFLIFTPKRIRRFAFVPLVGLQILIFSTGNYCFFNLLTIALCFFLVEDDVIPSWLRLQKPEPEQVRAWPRWIIAPVIILVGFLSVYHLTRTIGLNIPWPEVIEQAYNRIEPFRIVSNYGLFSVMTTKRPEIIIEGSNDQLHWQPYEFKYKPGDLKRRPGFVEPHQPRLDWQMWFAALDSYDSNRWFLPLCRQLLQGSPDVASLLAKNPFPDKPPRYLRAMLYQYHFTDLQTKGKDGTWWRRELEGPYCPVLSLK